MKAILISIQSPHVCNILNDIKLWEIRKKFPKDYVGWVYIYVTKSKPYLSSNSFKYYIAEHYEKYMGNRNGKVVARFWCDKVEEIKWDYESPALSKYITCDLDEWELCNKSCLTGKEMVEYLGKENKGTAIHINDLEIFDKPKEISEFNYWNVVKNNKYAYGEFPLKTRLINAPQSWCYIEI